MQRLIRAGRVAVIFVVSVIGFANAQAVSGPLQAANQGHESHAVEVTSDPAGAQIEVDGNLVARTPAVVYLTEGRHISIRQAGYHRWLMVVAGSETTIHADLKKIVASAVRGRVLWNEMPVVGVEVYADECGSAGRAFGPVRSDAGGNFELTSVPDGLLCLFAFPKESEFLSGRALVRLQVAPGGNTSAPDAYLCKKMSGSPPLFPANARPILQWDQQPGAVTYHISLYQTAGQQRGRLFDRAGWKTTSVQLDRDLMGGDYFWVVEAYNVAGHIIGCTAPVRFNIDHQMSADYRPPQPLPAPRRSSPAQPIRISASVAMGFAVHQVEPPLPPSARGPEIPRTATYDAVIGRDGIPREIRPTTCHPQLCDLGANAARGWRFRPELLNGNEVQTQIMIRFQDSTASQSSQSALKPLTPNACKPFGWDWDSIPRGPYRPATLKLRPFPGSVTYSVKLFENRNGVSEVYRPADPFLIFSRTGLRTTTVDSDRDLSAGDYFWEAEALDNSGHAVGCTGPIWFSLGRTPKAITQPAPGHKLGVPEGAESDVLESHVEARASHILIRFPGGESAGEPSPADVIATRNKAQQILDRLRAGADFMELARKESQDPSSGPRGGDLGWVQRGVLIPELDSVIFSDAVGSLELVRSSMGFHVLRIDGFRTVASMVVMKQTLERPKPEFFRQAQAASWDERMTKLYGTPEKVTEKTHSLEAKLKDSPDDVEAHRLLLDIYAGPQRLALPPEERRRIWVHYIWFVEHQPTSMMVNPGILTCAPPDKDFVEQARQAWAKQAASRRINGQALLNGAGFLRSVDRDESERLYMRVLQAPDDDPNSATYRAAAAGMLEMTARSTATPERQAELHRTIFIELEKAYRKRIADGDPYFLDPSLPKPNPDDARSLGKEESFRILLQLTKAAFDAGELEKAQSYAQELLKQSPKHEKYWNYGNAIHDGNMILGRISLRNGDVAAAKEYLLAAGQAPGTPTLVSYGPNMSLAKDLLERNEKDVVLAYFDLCRKFWRSGGAQLDRWTATVQAGGMPDFRANLNF